MKVDTKKMCLLFLCYNENKGDDKNARKTKSWKKQLLF